MSSSRASSVSKGKRNSSSAGPPSPAANGDNGAAKRRKTNSLRENSLKELRKDRNIVHVIFAIDQSGSMRTDDVKKAGGKATRWTSVFDCAEEFVKVQASSGSASTLGDVVFSLILWDDDARTIFQREPLLNSGEVPGTAGTHVRSKLIQARDKERPRGGTVFASAFREIRRLAEEDRKQSKGSKSCTYTKRYRPTLSPHTHADLGSHLGPVPFCDVHDLLLLASISGPHPARTKPLSKDIHPKPPCFPPSLFPPYFPPSSPPFSEPFLDPFFNPFLLAIPFLPAMGGRSSLEEEDC